MMIDIYCSASNSKKYLSVPAGTKVEAMQFPPELDKDLRKLRPFKSRLEIDPKKPRIALDARDIIGQIEAKGFAQHAASIIIKTRVTSDTTKPRKNKS